MISIITISLIVIITFVYVFYLINKTNKLNTMYAYQNNNINSNIEQEEINEETTSLEVQEPEIVTVYEDYTMEELSEEFLTHEQQLRDLFDTVTQTNLAKTDLFSNLREDDSEKTKDETKEEEFYTNTSKLEKEDFDDEFVEKSSNAKVFIIITIILMIIAIGVILYLKVFK